ncbi:MAG: helix-turn-helix transcriptional regulator, partial [Janthinobacterium lividum]
GKTSWETSQIISCSEPTVNFHIGNVNRKLNVRTRQEAISKAIKLRLIMPN